MKKKGPMKLMGKKKSAAKQKMKMVNVGGKKVPAFAKTGKNISDSRKFARAHYLSDSKAGEQLGQLLYKSLKK